MVINLRVGTRKSALALVQTNLVCDRIKQEYSDAKISIVPCVTKGDIYLSKSLSEFGGKGAFICEIEELLVNGDIDLAVHSAKDLPNEIDSRTELLIILPREDPRDVLLYRNNLNKNFKVVGTSSSRRKMFIKQLYPNIETKLLRGNVPTRIEKLKKGEYDAIILAMAGIKRLNLHNDTELCYQILDPTIFIPSGCQGIIAIQVLKDSYVSKIIKSLIDHNAQYIFDLERSILRKLGTSCQDAIGLFSRYIDRSIEVSICLGRIQEKHSGVFMFSNLDVEKISSTISKNLGM